MPTRQNKRSRRHWNRITARAMQNLEMRPAPHVGQPSTPTSQTMTSRTNGREYMSNRLSIGQIISAPYHVQDWDRRGAASDTSFQSQTLFGCVYSKRRKLIVIAKYEEHCLTIPIFTFRRTGLRDKNNNCDEFVGVREAADNIHFPSESSHPNLIAVRHPFFHRTLNDDGFHVFSPMSYAHITAPFCFRYRNTCTFEGRLEEESVRRLICLYQEYVGAM